VSASVEPVWSSLREAADAFCPPFEVTRERPGGLAVWLRDPESREELRLRYRSERGLFLRTYFLIVEAEIGGGGPARPGRLVLGRRALRWTRPKPDDAKRWSETLSSPELRDALTRLPVEKLTLAWEPDRATWTFSLETLAGSLTVTFFPPLATPNPLRRAEADALVRAVAALRSASARTPA
jgi:hypothetical protein